MRALVLALVLAGCNGGGEAPPAGSDTAPDTDAPDTDVVGDDDDDDTDDGDPIGFVAHLVDGAATGVRHATLGDLDGDGVEDIVASLAGAVTELDVPAGSVVLYRSSGALDSWTREDIVGTELGVRSPNGTTLHDVDGDGDDDVLVAFGSPFCDPLPNVDPCGGVLWMENTGGGWSRHPIVQGSLMIHTSVAVADIDGDGIDDIVTGGEDLDLESGQAQTLWFRGTGDGFLSTPYVIGMGGGAHPTVYDVDGDGDLDVAAGERTGAGGFVWFERTADPGGANPAGAWSRHVIDDSNGPGWMIRFVPDLLGDGQTIAVGTNHTNTVRHNDPDPWESAVFVLEPGADPTQPWSATPISTDIEAIDDVQLFPMDAPGVFDHGDVDDDGDIDLAVAGDGDPTVYLLEQTAPGTFTTRVLRGGIPRSGAAELGDVEGDGDLEILVTGQLNNVVYVIERI